MVDGSEIDRERFEAVFEAHHRRVLAYALRRTTSLADAEDVAADTFTVAWRRIADLPSAEHSLAWLLAVARRVAANQRRGVQRWRGLLERLRLQPMSDPAPVPDSPATEALARLRPDDRELLRLLAWDGLSQAEAGQVLGISANAVAIRLHRARGRFAAELAAILDDEAKGPGPSRTSGEVKGRLPGRTQGERTT